MLVQHSTLMIFYFGVFLLLIFIKFSYNNRFRLNVSKPNVYIFEYESSARKVITPYNILFASFQIISYTLLVFSLASRFFSNNKFSYGLLFQIFLLITVYTFYKVVAEFLLMIAFKKTTLTQMFKHIRVSFHNYLSYYTFFVSFFLYFFPFQNNIFSYLTIVFTSIFIFLNGLKYYNSIKKHTNLKTFQIFLYLCILEILPIIFVFYWVSFQIL